MATPAFFAVLRDATKLAATAADDLASQSAKMVATADEISALAGKAAAKAAGVAGDDLAVGAGQVAGVSPNRELPALWRISKGSFFNKLWLSVLLLVVDHYAPAAIMGMLLLGAAYLAYEGAEEVLEIILHHDDGDDDGEALMTEDEKVRGAIKTDIILSLEMLVIALATTEGTSLGYKVMVLGIIGLLMTVGVYGLIALIIRLDDMGYALARSDSEFRQRMGTKLVAAAPVVLRILGPLGLVAMLAVAGGILSHAMHWTIDPWPLALVSDIAIGLAAGLTLLAGHHLVTRFQK